MGDGDVKRTARKVGGGVATVQRIKAASYLAVPGYALTRPFPFLVRKEIQFK